MDLLRRNDEAIWTFHTYGKMLMDLPWWDFPCCGEVRRDLRNLFVAGTAQQP